MAHMTPLPAGTTPELKDLVEDPRFARMVEAEAVTGSRED